MKLTSTKGVSVQTSSICISIPAAEHPSSWEKHCRSFPRNQKRISVS